MLASEGLFFGIALVLIVHWSGRSRRIINPEVVFLLRCRESAAGRCLYRLPALEKNPPVFPRVFALGDDPRAAKVHGIQAQEPEA